MSACSKVQNMRRELQQACRHARCCALPRRTSDMEATSKEEHRPAVTRTRARQTRAATCRRAGGKQKWESARPASRARGRRPPARTGRRRA
eukprot:5360364-Alexandrium_andersonii.AAC.1